MDSMGCNLKGLGMLTRWIRPQSYYHWKVAEFHQLQHCPHLQGMPVPLGPMEHPNSNRGPVDEGPRPLAPLGTAGQEV